MGDGRRGKSVSFPARNEGSLGRPTETQKMKMKNQRDEIRKVGGSDGKRRRIRRDIINRPDEWVGWLVEGGRKEKIGNGSKVVSPSWIRI